MADNTSELTLLGKSGTPFPDSPQQEILETFPNRHPQRAYWVTLTTSEFSSLCPVTGQPDYAKVEIRYQPAALCLETKSLKYYLASYRTQKAFNEDIVNHILEDLAAAAQPRALEVRGEFASRGGIQLTAEATLS